MPLTRAPSPCWILLVHSDCAGELHDYHWPSDDPGSLPAIEGIRWGMFAHNPLVNPPSADLEDAPCLLVQCRVCGNHVGDGEHFADGEHAWEAAEQDGWREDLCPFCQPYQSNQPR